MVFLPSFFDGFGRISSTKRRKKVTEDREGKEIAEAMVKEAKKKASVCSSGTVWSEKSQRFAAVFSQRGEKGINQDRAIVWEGFGCQEDIIFCGMFDGHGPWGHVIAKRVKRTFPSSLLCHWQQTLSPLPSPSPSPEYYSPFDIWKQSYLKTFSAIDHDLKLHSSIDSYTSGCTALTAVIQGNHLVIANAGDSRAVLATNSGYGLIPVQLSVDFKPNIQEEAERIKESEGRVICREDEPGVYRVCMPNRDSPGLAVSRAFGDYSLKDYGVISKPDVTYRKITEKDQFLIMASDGVWDVMSNEEAVEMVASETERRKCGKRIVKRATELWQKKRRDFAMDDISALCLFFHP